ncbi:MAG: hypothetical protein Q4D99_00080 [Bacillota bacterium]|nr:hypothetical protein [Bacillota bacterium]
MKKILVIMLAVCLCIGFCSCGGDSGTRSGADTGDSSDFKTVEFRDLVLHFDSADWETSTMGELKEQAEADGDDDLMSLLESYDLTGQNYFIDELVVYKQNAPGLMFLYCEEVAGTGTINSVEKFKENIKNNGREYTVLDDIKVAGVDGLDYGYETDANTERHIVMFFVNGYRYSIWYVDDGDGEMEKCAKELIDTITVKESLSTSTFRVDDLSWELDGAWEDDEVDDSDEDFIDGINRNSADTISVDAEVTWGEMSEEFYLDQLGNNAKLLDKTSNEITGVGTVYCGIYEGENDGDVFYVAEVVLNYDGKCFNASIIAFEKDKVVRCEKQLEETITRD